MRRAASTSSSATTPTPHLIINALHQLTDVKILSNPSLVVVDNQEATLEVGDQVPVSTGSATVLSANNAVVNTIDYKNTGIILDVMPRVSPDNTIQLDISQEISNVVDPHGRQRRGSRQRRRRRRSPSARSRARSRSPAARW